MRLFYTKYRCTATSRVKLLMGFLLHYACAKAGCAKWALRLWPISKKPSQTNALFIPLFRTFYKYILVAALCILLIHFIFMLCFCHHHVARLPCFRQLYIASAYHIPFIRNIYKCTCIFSVTVICIPAAVGQVLYRIWIFGEFMCKLTGYLQGM